MTYLISTIESNDWSESERSQEGEAHFYIHFILYGMTKAKSYFGTVKMSKVETTLDKWLTHF